MAKPKRAVATKPKTKPVAPDLRKKASAGNTLPIYMVTLDHTKLLHVSRVPCIGEVVYVPNEDNPHDGTNWRVIGVQHIPLVENQPGVYEIVAELHALPIEKYDAWEGKYPRD
jgi:hypothetical protein